MDPVAAKYIGAGIACLGMGGAGIGLGNIFGSYLAGALRNPSAADGLTCIGCCPFAQSPAARVGADPRWAQRACRSCTSW